MSDSRPAAFIAGESEAVVFGLSTRERLEIQLPRAKIDKAETAETADFLLSAAHVYGASVLEALAKAAPGTALTDDKGRLAAIVGPADVAEAERDISGGAPAPEGALNGAELAGRYDKALRKRADPMVRRVGPRGVAEAEQQIFDATYKGVTDFVTKYLWPRPALRAVRFCVRHGITPNQVTYASIALVFATFWLFWVGQFWLGLVVGWFMTFLDTVDGKLARATLTSSPIGNILDHGTDLIHPPFWWWAWAVGLFATGRGSDYVWLALGVILVGYVLQRVLEGIFIHGFGMHVHIWRPFDSFFRVITARRNPNMAILTVATVVGAPRQGFIAVAVWVAIGLVVHAVQIAQGFRARRNGPLESWMAD